MAFSVIGKTVMKSLFGKPATAMYPVVKNEFYPNTRGHIENDMTKCNFCTLCSKRCPAGAIEVDRTGKKWEIDRSRCVMCNFCVSVCARNSLSTERQYASPMTDKAQRLYTLYGERSEPAGEACEVKEDA